MNNNVVLKDIVNEVIIYKPETQEERIKELEAKMESIAQMLYLFKRSGLPKKKEEAKKDTNIDGLPLNTCYLGYSAASPFPYVLVVNEDGKLTIGSRFFKTLDEATEFVAGKKENSLEFWQTIEGVDLGDFIK
jgi:hypothetical protein